MTYEWVLKRKRDGKYYTGKFATSYSKRIEQAYRFDSKTSAESAAYACDAAVRVSICCIIREVV